MFLGAYFVGSLTFEASELKTHSSFSKASDPVMKRGRMGNNAYITPNVSSVLRGFETTCRDFCYVHVIFQGWQFPWIR